MARARAVLERRQEDVTVGPAFPPEIIDAPESCHLFGSDAEFAALFAPRKDDDSLVLNPKETAKFYF